MQIIDDALDVQVFNRIKSVITGDRFTWSFLDDATSGKKADKTKESKFGWYYYHGIYKDYRPHSEAFELMLPVLTFLNVKALIRIKVGSYPRTEKLYNNDFHVDQLYPHKVALLSLNTCDGYTEFEGGKRVDSVANRIVIFDGTIPHRSSTTTNASRRLNINFNYM